jgi:hypothetical protein
MGETIDTTEMSDERKLRRFAMDIVRAAAEGVITAELTRDLAVQWGLLEEAVMDGRPWLNFTPLLLGNELLDG